MALPDLTGQNIENTYQRVLQTDGTTIYDGTGSAFLPVSASHAVTASYAEYAVSASHEIIKEVSSSYADYAKESGLSTSSISASYALTASYALNSPDTFPYTGSAVISGSLTVTGSTKTQYLTASGLNYPTIDGDEKQLIKSINNVQERGLVDFFVVDNINEEKRGIPFEKGERFAKTYPTLPYHLKDEDCLYWRSFKSSNCSPCAKRESNKNIEKPLLIYNGVI